MKCQAKIHSYFPTREGATVITLVTRSDCVEEVEDIKEFDLDLTLKKHRKSKSLDANAYAWVLIDKIAEKLGLPSEEVYREAIRSISGVSDIVCVRETAKEAFLTNWRSKGIGWQAEAFPSKISGCVNVRIWYGSSTYDSKQISDLIDSLIQEAKTLGITTETPDEIARIKSLWEEKSDTKRKDT